MNECWNSKHHVYPCFVAVVVAVVQYSPHTTTQIVVCEKYLFHKMKPLNKFFEVSDVPHDATFLKRIHMDEHTLLRSVILRQTTTLTVLIPGDDGH